jgi:hypothetical protein
MPHGHSKSVEVRPIAVPYLQQTTVCLFFPAGYDTEGRGRFRKCSARQRSGIRIRSGSFEDMLSSDKDNGRVFLV